ncbi:MAG TPA: response regulator [Polyangia bacterium]|nr:response regulator [Polyangia bacterium]
MVVDDNVEYAQNIAEILQIGGCAAEVYASAEEALPVALAPRVRAVITDYRLPGMNGIELVRRIFSERQGVQAVVISAYADDTAGDAARMLGANFLPKPVDFSVLGRLVRFAS